MFELTETFFGFYWFCKIKLWNLENNQENSWSLDNFTL